jgi:hypothetical protein
MGAVPVFFLSVFFIVAGAAQAEERVLDLGRGNSLRYEVLDSGTPDSRSARATAGEILRLLAEGSIEKAAALSNAPQRRYEVLRDYRATVGDDEFKRVFAQYLGNRIVDEIAIGDRRLLIWDLAEATHHLTGQYYVEVDGRFLMDDVPSEERAQLTRVLQSYRKSATPSKQKD